MAGLFDHLGGEREQRRRHLQAERLGGLYCIRAYIANNPVQWEAP
jgi:hypothetical protein